MATSKRKPLTDDEEVAEWDRLAEHSLPPDAMRWYPDDKEITQ